MGRHNKVNERPQAGPTYRSPLPRLVRDVSSPRARLCRFVLNYGGTQETDEIQRREPTRGGSKHTSQNSFTPGRAYTLELCDHGASSSTEAAAAMRCTSSLGSWYACAIATNSAAENGGGGGRAGAELQPFILDSLCNTATPVPGRSRPSTPGARAVVRWSLAQPARGWRRRAFCVGAPGHRRGQGRQASVAAP